MAAFEWDKEKEKQNIRKHGIPFLRAQEIFDGPCLFDIDDRKDYGEERYNALGITQNYLVNVTFTIRNGKARIISARPAGKNEKKLFIEWIQSGGK